MGCWSSRFSHVGLASDDQERGYGCAMENEFQARQHSQEPDCELASKGATDAKVNQQEHDIASAARKAVKERKRIVILIDLRGNIMISIRYLYI